MALSYFVLVESRTHRFQGLMLLTLDSAVITAVQVLILTDQSFIKMLDPHTRFDRSLNELNRASVADSAKH